MGSSKDISGEANEDQLQVEIDQARIRIMTAARASQELGNDTCYVRIDDVILTQNYISALEGVDNEDG